MSHEFWYSFIPIFVAMDVAGLVPIFLSLTETFPQFQRRRVIVQALTTAFLISLIFIFVGRWIFRVLGVTVHDFKIAGGLLLLLVAILDVVQVGEKPYDPSQTLGIVPLGTPLIVGPAVLTSLVILVDLQGIAPTLLALCANLLLVGLACRQAETILRWLGEGGMRAVSRVTSLLLAAIAVSMIRLGLQGFFSR